MKKVSNFASRSRRNWNDLSWLRSLGYRLHQQIDTEVAAAYGWPSDLAPAEIITRLVALNAERAVEEKAGTIRWLRPAYQIPRFGAKLATKDE